MRKRDTARHPRAKGHVGDEARKTRKYSLCVTANVPVTVPSASRKNPPRKRSLNLSTIQQITHNPSARPNEQPTRKRKRRSSCFRVRTPGPLFQLSEGRKCISSESSLHYYHNQHHQLLIYKLINDLDDDVSCIHLQIVRHLTKHNSQRRGHDTDFGSLQHMCNI